jgi:hypothetical protein
MNFARLLPHASTYGKLQEIQDSTSYGYVTYGCGASSVSRHHDLAYPGTESPSATHLNIDETVSYGMSKSGTGMSLDTALRSAVGDTGMNIAASGKWTMGAG